MKIAFNVLKTGLGNNGGSRTIIRNAEVLSIMGNDVYIVTRNNNYTWHDIDNNLNIISKIPKKADVIIATGIKSVKSTLQSSIKRKFYYIRGYEIWKSSKKELLKSYKSLNCIVNSSWLRAFLLKNGIKSHLIYNGIDFKDFYNLNKKREYDLGALFHKKHKTKRHIDAVNIAKKINKKIKMLNKDLKNPNQKQLNKWYNKIKVWVAPTELEGMHNPPMEASLAGCALVCTNHKRSGMSDYAIHNKTALVHDARNIKQASRYVEKLLKQGNLRKELNKNMIKLLKNKIGTREKNMKQFLKVIKN